jgi:hypothetical protein
MQVEADEGACKALARAGSWPQAALADIELGAQLGGGGGECIACMRR